MSSDIINITQYGDALRSTGYKNIESAVSEIIDNSIEACAKDVFVIVKDTVPEYSGKRYVTEIAFLDNGIGMESEVLQSCLSIGYGTRRERRGMGRFGVGLPQASLHVTPFVEVYSWQGGLVNCKKTFLDIEKVKNGEQTKFEEPEKCQIPEEYFVYINLRTDNKEFSFEENGTLVIWKNCDNVSPKTVKPLFDRLEFRLGQKFRYLIQDGTQNIYLIHQYNEQYNRKVMPNDSLFLMKSNLVLGNVDTPKTIELRNNCEYTEPLFEPYKNDKHPNGIVELTVKYFDKKTKEIKESTVSLKFSVIRKEFYNENAIPGNPGGTKMGKHVGKLEGISIVRARREIDFGNFDFYSNLNQPEHRWWGCEINFNPDLDEAFGVSNNKQHVELIKLDDEEYAEDDVKPIWLQLRDIIKNTINAMYGRNKEIRKGSRTNTVIITPTEQIINVAEKDSKIKGASDKSREAKPKDELIKEIKDTLVKVGVEEPTKEDVDKFLLNKVSIQYLRLNRGPFFDYSFDMGLCICTINLDHIFYKNFLTNIEKNNEAKIAFELFVASLIKTIDESTEKRKDSYDELVQDWNEKLRKYINAQCNKDTI